MKSWLAENRLHIEAFFLPSYSPELNPDERLNADLKQAIGSKVPMRTKAKRAAAIAHAFIAANRIGPLLQPDRQYAAAAGSSPSCSVAQQDGHRGSAMTEGKDSGAGMHTRLRMWSLKIAR